MEQIVLQAAASFFCFLLPFQAEMLNEGHRNPSNLTCLIFPHPIILLELKGLFAAAVPISISLLCRIIHTKSYTMSWLNSLLLICTINLGSLVCIAIASSLGMDIIHRYSDRGREAFKASGKSTQFWPAKNTKEFHDLLFLHDRARHGRRLQSDGLLIFSEGNLTTNLGQEFGWITYALVDVGTPNVSFLVALDTGSDLFWLPCECQQCSNIDPNDYPTLKAVKSKLSEYTPSSSSTSTAVSCSDSLCELSSQCSSSTQQCPYKVEYLSDNTSTSGVLVKDVVHFAHEHNSSTQAQANITFGCGRVQTGDFLTGGAPNGLLGLGMGDVSVPSLLAKAGLIQDTFSMCFSDKDESGRIIFGDTGASNQQRTSFISTNAYYISIQGIQVGDEFVQSKFNAIFDTGTTFTYLPSAVYSSVTTYFNKQIQLQRVQVQSSSEVYRYCYSVQSSTINVPVLVLNFSGGASFEAFNPYIYLVNQKGDIQAICFVVLESSSVAIIGQNFMTGYRITFNKDAQELGWINSTCYDEAQTAPAPYRAPVTGSAPIGAGIHHIWWYVAPIMLYVLLSMSS